MAIHIEQPVEVEELSVEEGRDVLDRQARRYLDISGEDFAAAWERGEFKGDDRPEVMRVAILLPLGR